MSGNGEVKQKVTIDPKAIVVLNNNFGELSAKEIKKAVDNELQRLIQNGEISEKDAKLANKLFDNELAGALVRRNKVEGTYHDTLYGLEDLADEKANQLMKDTGLTIGDLYDASKFAGADYNVNYTKLSKEEKQMAENGEITPSELKNIQNSLNEKIKANGGDRVLNDKETKQLMKGLGLSVDKKFNIGKIILAGLGLGWLGGITGAATSTGAKTVTSVATTILDGNKVTNEAVTHTGAKGIGLAGGLAVGAAIGAGAEMIHEANRKEKAFGEQGGVEGGQGSVTNKTEAKMHIIGKVATEAMENGDVPSPKPADDPWKKLMEE